MAIMLLTASPLVIANEDTQILGDGTTIGDLREGLVTSFDRSDDALNKEASTSVDKEERDGLSDEDCLTIEEWREKSEKDWDRKNWSGEDEKDWDRKDVDRKESNEYREGNEKRVGDEAADRDVSQKDEDCLTAEQWEARYSYDENREEPCLTLREFERKLFDERKDWERDDKDWDRENWSDEEREERDEDEACLTMEEWKERYGRDKEGRDKEDRGRDEFRRSVMALAEACADGDEEACEKLEALTRDCGRERDDRDDEDRDEEDNEEREDSDEETGE